MNASYPLPPVPPPPTHGQGGPQYWTPTELVGAAWARTKEHLGLLIGVSLVFGIIAVPLPYAPVVLMMTKVVEPNSVEFHGIQTGQSVLFMILCSYFLAGFTRICVAIAKGQAPSFGMFFSGKGFLGVLGFQFLFTLPGLCTSAINLVGALAEVPALFFVSSLVGLLVLVPIVFAWVVWGQAPYLVVDKGLGTFAAMGESANLTRGQRGNVFLAYLLGGLLLMAGAMACGLGMIVTGPLFYVMQAVLYARLSGQDPNGFSQNGSAYGGYATYPSGPSAGYAPAGGGAPPPAGGFGSPY